MVALSRPASCGHIIAPSLYILAPGRFVFFFLHKNTTKSNLDLPLPSVRTQSDLLLVAMGRKFFVGGNWKCNGTVDQVEMIVKTLNAGQIASPDVVEVVVSPPYVFLPTVKAKLRPEIQVAAQNCWVKKGGAFTGEVSAEMLVNLGVPWVILGHSERRSLLGESSEFVGEKVAYALAQGLKVIACVGETLEQREAGSTMEVVAEQTKAIAGTNSK